MPSLVTFPFIQCHQVCGLAESGGLRKPDWSESVSADAAGKPSSKAAATAGRRSQGVNIKRAGEQGILRITRIRIRFYEAASA
jgi:hypothetical protein